MASSARCRTILKLLDSRKARAQIGGKRRVNLGRFHCSALNRLAGSADYRCKSGRRSWYMHTYAGGDWDAPDSVILDW